MHGAGARSCSSTQYGLDRPILVQYWSFLTNAVHGNLGVSFQIRGLPITPLVMRELSVSAELGGTALLITIGLGTVVRRHRGNPPEHLGRLHADIDRGHRLQRAELRARRARRPHLQLLPPQRHQWRRLLPGDMDRHVRDAGGAHRCPAIVLGFYTSGQVTRITRAAMLEVLQQDYIRTARAKGLKTRVVTIRHAFRNALIPVISILGPLVISIITGSVIIENIFGIPGLGKEFVESILAR